MVRLLVSDGAQLQHMDDLVKDRANPNFSIHSGGGGVEGFNVVPSAKTLTGPVLTIPTSVNETILLAPGKTPKRLILIQMQEPCTLT